jgi:hypothetical protein
LVNASKFINSFDDRCRHLVGLFHLQEHTSRHWIQSKGVLCCPCRRADQQFLWKYLNHCQLGRCHFKMLASERLKAQAHAPGVLTHLTPVKRLKNSKGEKTSFRHQGRCKECQRKTIWQSSDCHDDRKTVYLCATKNGQRCFLNHLSRNHAHLDECSALCQYLNLHLLVSTHLY